MTDATPEQLEMARRCAEEALMERLPSLVGYAGKIATTRAAIARIRSGEGDNRAEVKAALRAIQETTERAASAATRTPVNAS